MEGKNHFLNFDNFFLRNHRFLRNTFFIFLVISQELFDLQRRTIPHFNCLKELITPLLQCNCHRIRHFWDIRRNVFPIFFTHTLPLPSIWKFLFLPHNFCCCRSAMWERMEGDQGSSDLHIWVRFFQLFRDAIDLSTDLTSRLFYTSLLTLYFQWQGRCFEIESGFDKDKDWVKKIGQSKKLTQSKKFIIFATFLQ